MSEVLKRVARETLREVGDVPALIRHESAGMSVFIPDYYVQRLKLTNNKLYDEIFIEPQWGFYVIRGEYEDDSYYVVRIRTGVRLGRKVRKRYFNKCAIYRLDDIPKDVLDDIPPLTDQLIKVL